MRGAGMERSAAETLGKVQEHACEADLVEADGSRPKGGGPLRPSYLGPGPDRRETPYFQGVGPQRVVGGGPGAVQFSLDTLWILL